MPQIPEPKGSPPDLMPFLRWVRETLIEMIKDQERRQSAAANTNASQNSTMSTLVERLGTVEQIMSSINSSLTLDASQTVSGTFDDARIPALDAAKIASGTITRPVNAAGSVTASGDVGAAGHGTFNAAWTNNLSAVTRLAVWMDVNGRLGQTSSSEIYKKNIEDYSPSEAAVRLLRLRRFNWDADYGPNWKHKEVGLIAQQLHNLGLRWLVTYDDKGYPFAVQYERLALALLPLTQRLANDVDSLKARVSSLEERLAALEARLA